MSVSTHNTAVCTYYDNGSLRSICSLENNKYNGIYTLFAKTDNKDELNIIETGMYENGIRVGEWKLVINNFSFPIFIYCPFPITCCVKYKDGKKNGILVGKTECNWTLYGNYLDDDPIGEWKLFSSEKDSDNRYIIKFICNYSDKLNYTLNYNGLHIVQDGTIIYSSIPYDDCVWEYERLDAYVEEERFSCKYKKMTHILRKIAHSDMKTYSYIYSCYYDSDTLYYQAKFVSTLNISIWIYSLIDMPINNKIFQISSKVYGNGSITEYYYYSGNQLRSIKTVDRSGLISYQDYKDGQISKGIFRDTLSSIYNYLS